MKELVKGGFTIKDACFGLGITRSRYYEVLSKKSGQKGEGKQIDKTKGGKFDQTNRMLVQRIKAIKGKHPFWAIDVLGPG